MAVRFLPRAVIAAIAICSLPAAAAFAQSHTAAVSGAPALTVYNQGFGVVREALTLDLISGENHITFDNATAHLEPDSVILRDTTGKRRLSILEQDYEGDPLSEGLLLSRYEGQTISFVSTDSEGRQHTVTGRIVRSGYVPHAASGFNYGQGYYQAQYAGAYGGGGQPIIEVDEKLRFGLPGTPIFPSLGDDAFLKPTLAWTLASDKAGPVSAELSYVTGGMSWKADYNLVLPEAGDDLEMAGLVTIDNQSGRTFENAHLKLMAGDVNKVQPQGPWQTVGGFGGALAESAVARPNVTEAKFDEYHLYTLERQTTLRDRETKQVEFAHAEGVASKRLYVYDGADLGYYSRQGYDDVTRRSQRDYGTNFNPKVWVVREFVNSKANHLGIPLPKGRVRFYRRASGGGALEFIGENEIDHTPAGETVRAYTGNAFDLVGERHQTNFEINESQRFINESFEIRLRNRGRTPVTIRVVEHLYRWSNWTIQKPSDEFTKKDSQTIEFPVAVAPDQEKVVTYTAHYTW